MKEESLEKGGLEEQVASHISWLRSLGFDVEHLTVGRWVKCRGQEEQRPSGAYAYATWVNPLMSGGEGLFTRAKRHGDNFEHKTIPGETPFFRLSPSKNVFRANEGSITQQSSEALDRVVAFWSKANDVGRSPYLERKGVRAYGMKFRSSLRFGNTAVIPMRDVQGILKGVQCINDDGSKRILTGSVLKESFHIIGDLCLDKKLLLVEGYATGAFLHELTALSVCVCFAACNLVHVAQSLRLAFPSLMLVIAADNDRHLQRNEGLQSASKAAAIVKGLVLLPDFGDVLPSKSSSDWLDLARIKSVEEARCQIQDQLNSMVTSQVCSSS